jgi:hypothetical protein
MMKMTKTLLAVAAFLLTCGMASAANPPTPTIPDGTAVTVVENGGTMNFVGPMNVIHEKAIGSKVTFSLIEGQKRSIYVSRGDKVTTQLVRVAMPEKRKK